MMIEKGKVPRLGELWVAWLIKADLQLIMRFILDNRVEATNESDKRTSKYNHGSRKRSSLETMLL